MVSFKTAFLVHAACSGLFCVPYAILGLDGMIGLFSEGAETGTKFGLHVTAIDCLKNMIITATSYIMSSCTDKTTQKNTAIANIVMCIGCLVCALIWPPAASTLPPPPAIVYVGVTVTTYAAALLGGGDEETEKAGKKK